MFVMLLSYYYINYLRLVGQKEEESPGETEEDDGEDG